MSRLGYTFVASLVAWASLGAMVEQLDGINLDLSQVADSGGYYVYSYSITNPSSSTWAISIVKLDIGATSGTPSNLATTGELLDATVSSAGDPHAEVGPITPSGWTASLTQGAELWWFPPSTGFTTSDSVAPGETRAGFGIRSSYLPGINVVAAEPTVESCCLQLGDTSDGAFYPSRRGFSVTGDGVIPRYMPAEVTITLLQSQLTAVCTDPLWLDDSALCAEFDGLLDSAAAAFSEDEYYEAAMELRDLLDRVETEEAEMHSNAYWLLFRNIRQAYANVAAAGPDSLGVICTPSSVERAGASISCVPDPAIPPIEGSPFELTGWRFRGGTGNEFDVTPAGSPPATWEGIMVASGAVWTYGNVEGVPDSASTAVVVTARSWSAIPMADSFPEHDQDDLGDMPTIPTVQADLAHYHSVYPTGLTMQQLLARFVTVPNGPNATLVYFSDPILAEYTPNFEINRDALTDTQNPWYQNHPVGGGGGTCRRSDLSTTVLDFFVDRMTDEFEAVTDWWPESDFHEVLEGTVSIDLNGQWAAFAAAATAQEATITDVREELGPAVPPCTLLY